MFFDVRSVLDKRLAHERQKQQPDDDSEDQEARLLRARADLTEEQAAGQRLRNERDSKKVVDTGFCTLALSRIAAVLDGLPLAVQRRYPDMDEHHLQFIKKEIARTMNPAAGVGHKLPGKPDSVFYLCEHSACVIRQPELNFSDARYICERTGVWTRDGLEWYAAGGK